MYIHIHTYSLLAPEALAETKTLTNTNNHDNADVML